MGSASDNSGTRPGERSWRRTVWSEEDLQILLPTTRRAEPERSGPSRSSVPDTQTGALR